MPISLHDFSENFVVKSNGLPAFGRCCSPLGFTRGNQKIGVKMGKKRFENFSPFRPLP